MRRHPVVGLAVPGRKLQHRQIGREEFQRAGQLLHARTVAADHGKADRRWFGPRRHRAREIGDHQTFRAFRDIREGQRRGRGASNSAGDRVGAFMRRDPPETT